MSNLVWTQYGPVPREALVANDEVSESAGTREIRTIWRLQHPLKFVATEPMKVTVDGGEAKTYEIGEVVELPTGTFMRSSCVVEILMPQGLSGAQAQM
jgi:hypothetical protein